MSVPVSLVTALALNAFPDVQVPSSCARLLVLGGLLNVRY